jgi:hypothetical protein
MQAAISEFQMVDNPQALEPAGWRIKFKRGTSVLSSQEKAFDAPSATFSTTLTPGSYSASVQRLSTLGSVMGPEVSSEPVVVAGPAQFEAPLTVTFSL